MRRYDDGDDTTEMNRAPAWIRARTSANGGYEQDAERVERRQLVQFGNAAALRNQRLAPPVGSFPVVFFVSRTNVANCHTFALFHFPLRHVNGNLKDPACGHVRAACEELVHIMEALLSDELVYRRADDPRRPEPEWGFYERVGRRRRKWQWRWFKRL